MAFCNKWKLILANATFHTKSDSLANARNPLNLTGICTSLWVHVGITKPIDFENCGDRSI